ncbi:MAG: 50S ribosomal protein L18 [Myxococcales bacterium]
MISDLKQDKRSRRKAHIRKRVTGTPERPRLTVYKSLKHIYAQVVDDTKGATLAYASSLEAEGEGSKGKKEAAKKVGAIVAKRCREKQIEQVVFDRNGFDYHGRVAAVAEGARAAGLKF